MQYSITKVFFGYFPTWSKPRKLGLSRQKLQVIMVPTFWKSGKSGIVWEFDIYQGIDQKFGKR